MARRLYFGYGSNMSVKQMAQRCPASKPLGPGVLQGWRFIINDRGTASIVRAHADEVHGVLFSVTATCLNTLDAYEGVAKKRYLRRHLPIRSNTARDTDIVTAIVYAGLDRQPKVLPSVPIRAYLSGVVVPAAQFWGFPDGYLQHLSSFVPETPLGPTKKTRRSPKSRWRA